MKVSDLSERTLRLAGPAVLCVFFLFMLLILHWSPLAGDDWIYASEVRYTGVIAQTVYEYLTWSGRVLSEFWGFVFTSRKIIWEVCGSFLLAMTAGMIVLICSRRSLSEYLLTVFLILTVPLMIRTQTMTFAVGYAAYFIPVPLYFLLIFLLQEYFFKQKDTLLRKIMMGVLCFLIPLHMENMSVLLAFTAFSVCVYAFLKKRDMKFPLILLVIAGISCVIMFFSPGTPQRLSEEFSQSSALDLSRILTNWRPFLYLTLYYADALNTVLCLLLAFKNWQRKDRLSMALSAVFLIHIVLTFTDGCSNVAADSLWCIIFYGSLCLSAWREDEERRDLLLFLVAGVLVTSLIMLLSPSFPERTSVYALFCLITYCLLSFDSMEAGMKPLLPVILAAGILAAGVHWFRIYYSVHFVNIVRQAQVEYYRLRPDAGEAWFLAYPRGSVHSANIDTEEDVEHIKGFKEYYYLAEGLHLNFYYLDSYDRQSVLEQIPGN